MNRKFESAFLLASLGTAFAAPLSAQTTLFSYQGTNAVDKFGYSVRTVGDMNGDGRADFVYSAPFADTNGLDKNGFVEVRSGLDGSLLHRFDGDRAGDEYGYVVSSAGDVNADGTPDLVIGVLVGSSRFRGRVEVRSGTDGSILHLFDGAQSYDFFGLGADGVGDVNGDGFDDIGVGAPGRDNAGSAAGELRVYSGRDGSILWTANGAANNDQLGWFVSGAGDVNGDGFSDVVCGAPWADQVGKVDCGRAIVYSGADGSILHSVFGEGASDRFGWAVSGAGDVNRDGYADFLVGADQNDQNGADAGMVRVFSGADGSTLYTFLGEAAGDLCGWSARDAGDVNDDGHADILVGMPRNDSAFPDAGKVIVYSGATGLALSTITGANAGAEMGFSVACAGDVDDDGYPEVVLGAAFDSSVGTNAGAAYVVDLGMLGTPGTFTYRGAGCPGSDGRQPRIELTGRAALGDTYTVGIRAALPNTIAAMNYGLQWDLPLTGLATGCIAHAYPLGLRTVAMDGNGMASTVPFTQIPVVTSFIGVEIHHQWYVVDPTNNFIGISTSNAGVVTIGQQ